MAKRSWNPPPQGSRKRAKMKRSMFLDPENRRYPFQTMVGGKPKTSERGLMAKMKNVVA